MKNKEINREYDLNYNLIYYKEGSWNIWRKFDEKGRIIYYKNSVGDEMFYKFDKKSKTIEITHQEFKQIERTKLYLNIKRSNRFELMDI